MFLTFCVILVTLVFQGLTLPPLIRILGLAEASAHNCEEQEARRLVLQAAQERLEDIRRKDPSGFAEVYDDLEQHYKHRLASVGGLTASKTRPMRNTISDTWISRARC